VKGRFDMENLWAGIALQVAWAVLEPMLLTAVTAAVAWAVVKWHQWTGYQIDARNREALQSALENGVRAALQAMHQQRGHAMLISPSATQPVLEFAQQYVERSVPGAVKHFGLSGDRIRELAVPHL